MSTIRIEADDGGTFAGYLALPQERPAPAVVVLQEIFGVNAFIRETVEFFAKIGFVALAPDLFWRQKPGVDLSESQREEAQGYLKALDERLAVSDAVAAMRALRQHGACTGKVGAVGYCLGGKLAYLMAARSDIDAAVSYYGVGIQGSLGEVAKISRPLLLHIATSDALCPPAAQEQIISAAGANNVIRIEIYERAGHAFARKGGVPYMAQHAERANALTVEFLNRNLRS